MPILTTTQLDEQVTPHFTWRELLDRPESPVPDLAMHKLRQLCISLEKLRTAAGSQPIHITSGYRTIEHNTAIGGARQSYHLQGRAVDCYSNVKTPEELGRLARKWFKGVIIYPQHVHVDTRPTVYHAHSDYK